MIFLTDYQYSKHCSHPKIRQYSSIYSSVAQIPKSYVTTRHGAPAKLTADTNLGAVSRGNEWVIYNEFHSDGISKHTIRIVSAIVPELFISARPEYWYDTEFLSSQIRDQLVNIIACMTDNTESFICGGMPLSD